MKQKPAPVSGAKKKILIVDDDAHVVEVISSMLEDAYEIMEASYSLPAFFQVVRTVPDLMLVDLHMPIMNGLELIEQFKSYADTRDVPIVAITGMDTPEAREAAHKLGCIGFIPKPFDAKTFPEQVAAFLKPSRAAAKSRK